MNLCVHDGRVKDQADSLPRSESPKLISMLVESSKLSLCEEGRNGDWWDKESNVSVLDLKDVFCPFFAGLD